MIYEYTKVTEQKLFKMPPWVTNFRISTYSTFATLVDWPAFYFVYEFVIIFIALTLKFKALSQSYQFISIPQWENGHKATFLW